MKAKHLAIWNIAGAFLLPYSVIFYIVNFVFGSGDWFRFFSILLHLSLIVITPILSYQLLYLDIELQLLLDKNPSKKSRSLFMIAPVVLFPLIVLLPLGLGIAMSFSCGMLLWASAAAWWQVRQSKNQHEKAKREDSL